MTFIYILCQSLDFQSELIFLSFQLKIYFQGPILSFHNLCPQISVVQYYIHLFLMSDSSFSK